MEDIIFKFLVQSGYPRASIVSDIQSVVSDASFADATFIIVNPDSAEVLAVIKVVDAVSGDALHEQAAMTSAFAKKLGGKLIQGFLIRLDLKGKDEAEQVQFYRCWPSKNIQQLNANTFPDLGALSVNHKLASAQSSSPLVIPQERQMLDTPIGIGAYLPAILLFLLAAVDWYLRNFVGSGLLEMSQAVLLTGAASLLSLPALFRFRNSRAGDADTTD